MKIDQQQKLFNYMKEEHDVTLLVTDMQEIERILVPQLAERDKEIKEKDLLIKHWRNRFDHAESQRNDKTKSYSGILNWLEVTLSAESKLGASDEILNAYLTVKNYIQSLPQQQDSKEKLHTEVKEAKKQIKNGETLAHEEVFPQEQEQSEGQHLLKWIEELRATKFYTVSLDQILIKIKEIEKQHPTPSSSSPSPTPSPDIEILRLKTGWDKDKLAIIEMYDEIFQLKKEIESANKKKCIEFEWADGTRDVVSHPSDTISRILAEKKGNTHIKDCVKCKGKNLIKIVLHPVVRGEGFKFDISKCPSCDHQGVTVEEFFVNYKSS